MKIANQTNTIKVAPIKMANPNTTSKIQAGLFQFRIFLPSKLPIGIRLNSARMPLSAATSRKISEIVLEPKGKEIIKKTNPKNMLILGPAAEILPFVSRSANP